MQKLRKSKAYKVDKDEFVAVSMNVRDRDHFYAIIHYLNRTLGRTGWKAQKNTLKKFKQGRVNVKRLFWLSDPSVTIMLKLL
tara:strand:+ start:11492 stop:11737 length:246 start_codon:yes stop_codon:yes gene_type:complete